MIIEQKKITAGDLLPAPSSKRYDLCLVFGSRTLLERETIIKNIRQNVAADATVFCSTSGEIYGNEVMDETVNITGIQFEKSKVYPSIIHIDQHENSFEAGKFLIQQLPTENLKHVMVFSDGTRVNGSELVRGLNAGLPKGVNVTGGLAGDGARFEKTLVGLNDEISQGNIVAVGFYSTRLLVGHGSKGGWDSFGPDRKITKAKGNVLYELDGKSALQLYKEYLGELAEGLPGTALLFPLALRSENGDPPLVRTILGINEEEQSMTFAGDMPMGSYARLMRVNFDRLIDAASGAANETFTVIGKNKTDLAILISCVGRKLVLDQRVDEEIESVREVLGDEAVFTGFYSYGEISPLAKSMTCELHNQTMTITTFTEI